MLDEAKTYPHDYRLLFAGPVLPLIAGGQAVNIWAVTYLPVGHHLTLSASFGSADIDILENSQVIEYIKSLKEWTYTRRPPFQFGDGRVGWAVSKTPDGRPLLVEVLQSIPGVSKNELAAATTQLELSPGGVVCALLDPVVMLRSKLYNLRKFDQENRQDRSHVHILCHCIPGYLSELTEVADSEERQEALSGVVRRLFDLLGEHHTVNQLSEEGICIESLIPSSLRVSRIPYIVNVLYYQLPRLVERYAKRIKLSSLEGPSQKDGGQGAGL